MRYSLKAVCSFFKNMEDEEVFRFRFFVLTRGSEEIANTNKGSFAHTSLFWRDRQVNLNYIELLLSDYVV